MAALLVEFDKREVSGKLEDNNIRLYNRIIKEELIIPVPPQYTIEIYDSREIGGYYIYSLGSVPQDILDGYGKPEVCSLGVYQSKHPLKDEVVYIDTTEFKKEDFLKIPFSVLRENTMDNIITGGFWLNYLAFKLNKKLTLTGEEIINISKTTDIENKSRLLKLHEFIYLILRENKQISSFEKDIFKSKYEENTNLSMKGCLIIIKSIINSYLDNWHIIVIDEDSPTGYSLVSMGRDVFDITDLKYQFYNGENDYYNFLITYDTV